MNSVHGRRMRRPYIRHPGQWVGTDGGRPSGDDGRGWFAPTLRR